MRWTKEAYKCVVGLLKYNPSEFWKMSPQEFWLLLDMQYEKSKIGNLERQEVNELIEMLDA